MVLDYLGDFRFGKNRLFYLYLVLLNRISPIESEQRLAKPLDDHCRDLFCRSENGFIWLYGVAPSKYSCTFDNLLWLSTNQRITKILKPFKSNKYFLLLSTNATCNAVTMLIKYIVFFLASIENSCSA